MNQEAWSQFGKTAAHWRRLRGLSQEKLGHQVGHSQRHISFVETGRVKPSRSTVERMVNVLKIPPKDGNSLLQLLGYSAEYTETDENWSAVDPSLDVFRRMIIGGLDPFAAAVVDEDHRMILINLTFAHWITRFGLSRIEHPEEVFQGGFLHFPSYLFHPQGVKLHMPDWERFARSYIQAILRLELRKPEVGKRLLRSISAMMTLPPDWLRLSDEDAAQSAFVMEIPTIAGPVNVQYIPFVVSSPDTQPEAIFPAFSIDLFRPADPASEKRIRELAATMRPENVNVLLHPALVC